MSHIARQHDEVIGIAHQFRPGSLRRPLQVIEAAIEAMQVDVGQQRRDHPALRCAGLRTLHSGLLSVSLLQASTTGACNHMRMSLSTERSTTLMRKQAMSRSCGIVSK